ncbi:MAG: glycosyltransferase [Nanoarchaeota archaeon]|nr:glycosyltransferase [Nanoarchaeota archaeon]
MKKKRIKISVVVPTYNSEKTIEKCVKSIINSTYTNFELIIVDDFSFDNTRKIIQNIGVKVFNQKNMGAAASRNIGASLARGDLIVFIDSDVEINKDTFSNLIRLFSSNENLASVSGLYCDNKYQNIISAYQNIYESFIQKTISKLNNPPYINTSFFAIKKSIFKEIGGFNTQFRLANQEDIDFGKTLVSLGYKNIFSGKIKIKHLKEFSFPAFLKKKYYQGNEFIKVYSKQKNNLKMNHLTLDHTRNNVIIALLLIFIGAFSFFEHKLLYLLLLLAISFYYFNSDFINYVKVKKTNRILVYNFFIILQSFFILFGLILGGFKYVVLRK